jgi:hypothetical protein
MKELGVHPKVEPLRVDYLADVSALMCVKVEGLQNAGDAYLEGDSLQRAGSLSSSC